MERQLVKHGASTLMVSLPKKWLTRQDLNKGDAVHISELPDKLVISKGERNKELLEKRVHFKVGDYEEVRAVLGTLYRKGYEKIVIKYDNPHSIYFIQLITKAIQGFEIIEQDEKGCIIKNVSKDITIDIDEIKNKIINIIKTEFIIVREYLTNGIKGKDNEIKMLRDDAWKFRNMVYVHLKESMLFSSYEGYFMAHIIEYNASFLYWVYRSFGRSDIDCVSTEFLELYDAISEYFTKSITKMKKKDEDYIEYIMINREKLLKECEEYTLKKTNDRFLVIYLAMLVQNIHNPKSLSV